MSLLSPHDPQHNDWLIHLIKVSSQEIIASVSEHNWLVNAWWNAQLLTTDFFILYDDRVWIGMDIAV